MKDMTLPLFPGYLFCRLDPRSRLPVLQTPGVLSVVGIGTTPVTVPDSEIDAIRTMLASGRGVQPCRFLPFGDRVRIVNGPLRGIEGILTAESADHRLVVSVALLQRSVSVAIDPEWAVPVYGPDTSVPRRDFTPATARTATIAPAPQPCRRLGREDSGRNERSSRLAETGQDRQKPAGHSVSDIC
jgi:hypothetical protein